MSGLSLFTSYFLRSIPQVFRQFIADDFMKPKDCIYFSHFHIISSYDATVYHIITSYFHHIYQVKSSESATVILSDFTRITKYNLITYLHIEYKWKKKNISYNSKQNTIKKFYMKTIFCYPTIITHQQAAHIHT